ncbi:membrane bound O-acyl transferase MBOAT family protein [Calothrix brevissima NIES-22]|nr:membrane bound O-acyl transferase MBOAT family protein [Calothrix brevissima NIES-22]
MVFNSYTFAIFFLLVLIVYYTIKPWKIRKYFLLVVSYIFYLAWNPPFIILLWLTTVVNWYLSKIIYRTNQAFVRRLFLLCALVINLGLLGFFKYGDFLLDNFTVLAKIAGINYQPIQLGIVLPVGISFYTFHTLSYTLEIYFGKIKPWHSFIDYALFVTFFPQLVAGPILRYSFLQQCESPKAFSIANFGWGLSLIVLGLFEKVVVADALLAPVTESLYFVSGIPSFSAAWGGTLAFAGQIYCDFSGYSICAIGASQCLGFTLPKNFQFPYASVGFSDFWRRWHISLSSWLRDYLYIPLGGNRHGNLRTQINLMITMLLGGLWHGASWTFVIWGGLHGIYLVLERTLKKVLGHYSIWKYSGVQLLLSLVTFGLICVTWVFFRANSFTQAMNIINAMVHITSKPANIVLSQQSLITTLAVIFAILVIHWLFREKTLEEIVQQTPWWAISIALATMLYAIATLQGEDRSFIYFQF